MPIKEIKVHKGAGVPQCSHGGLNYVRILFLSFVMHNLLFKRHEYNDNAIDNRITVEIELDL